MRRGLADMEADARRHLRRCEAVPAAGARGQPYSPHGGSCVPQLCDDVIDLVAEVRRLQEMRR